MTTVRAGGRREGDDEECEQVAGEVEPCPPAAARTPRGAGCRRPHIAVRRARGNGGGRRRTTATSTASSSVGTATAAAAAVVVVIYDLRPDTAVRPAGAGGAKPKAGVPTADYAARGHDYGANFTLNICAPVVAPVTNVVGVDRAHWGNVSAYYEHNGEVYSLGQQSSVLVARGRELVLQYTGGSPCPEPRSRRTPYDDGDGDEEYDADAANAAAYDHAVNALSSSSSSSSSTIRRKSATFAFLCDRDPIGPAPAARVSFVGATPDECAYFFKIRSPHACAGAEPHKPGSVGPGGVFAIILGVALAVYAVGGVVYQRTVAHARGWRQLPNHTLWLGAWNFVRDLFIILTASCARCLPQPRGYRSLAHSPTGRSSRDDENRLIDQLDEEWED
ncbi:vacuolar sorting receptor [Niveomyces insectorum RCEF 264]|uniref:Vacuolar sorting receptor n=1 Tax=Niveomyces insectorum RCEF 264 TaxID=1081102 RepID=A0A167X0P4_9HYPO|nr:vacuolar sorting receptor [Niveomyces insectorum RCEF 264]